MLHNFASRHVLLLQGPAGPFFRRIAAELREVGATFTKVNFNAGDVFFFPGPDTVAYRGTAAGWPEFFRALVERVGVTDVFVFGDMRPLHVTAIEEARRVGVAVHVFEEGYLRPDFITFERDGVNGNSRMSKDPAFYRSHDAPAISDPTPVGATFGASAMWSIVYAIIATMGWWAYPLYRHHRPLRFWYHAYAQFKGGLRWLWYQRREAGVLERLVSEWKGRYFVVPLQVHCDFQLCHSDYRDVRDFVEEVVGSFAAHAAPDTRLVVKHHPMDRSFRDYSRLIERLRVDHGLGERLVYVHDLHLPTLLRHARGTIVINSTVGLSSLFHDTPVVVLGRAVYDLEGLGYRGRLDDFWRDPGRIDRRLFHMFQRWLRHNNQPNGSIWKRLPGYPSSSGVRWPTVTRHGAALAEVTPALQPALEEIVRDSAE